MKELMKETVCEKIADKATPKDPKRGIWAKWLRTTTVAALAAFSVSSCTLLSDFGSYKFPGNSDNDAETADADSGKKKDGHVDEDSGRDGGRDAEGDAEKDTGVGGDSGRDSGPDVGGSGGDGGTGGVEIDAGQDAGGAGGTGGSGGTGGTGGVEIDAGQDSGYDAGGTGGTGGTSGTGGTGGVEIDAGQDSGYDAGGTGGTGGSGGTGGTGGSGGTGGDAGVVCATAAAGTYSGSIAYQATQTVNGGYGFTYNGRTNGSPRITITCDGKVTFPEEIYPNDVETIKVTADGYRIRFTPTNAFPGSVTLNIVVEPL